MREPARNLREPAEPGANRRLPAQPSQRAVAAFVGARI